MNKETITHFLQYLQEEQSRSKHTTAAYRVDLLQFREYLALPSHRGPQSLGWSDVTTNVLHGYLGFLQAKEYAQATVARKIATIKSFFHYLADEQVIPSDPARTLEIPKTQKRKPQPLNTDAVERLLAEPGKSSTPKALRDKALLEILYATGIRVTEAVELDVSDVNLRKETLHCGDGSGRGRTLPLPPDTVHALRVYLVHGRSVLLADASETALFLNHRGQRLTRQGLWLIIKRYVKQVGIQETVTPQTLRHSFAAHLLHDGASLEDVQERLGHANISTTQVYRDMVETPRSELQIDGRSVTRAELDAMEEPSADEERA